MQDSFRKSFVTLPLFGPLAVLVAAASFVASHRCRVASAQICLADTGTGAGNTKAMINVNGAPVTVDGDLIIAGAAPGKTDTATITMGSNQFPGGALLNPGDVVTVDITAVPVTTKPAGGSVILELVQVDV